MSKIKGRIPSTICWHCTYQRIGDRTPELVSWIWTFMIEDMLQTLFRILQIGLSLACHTATPPPPPLLPVCRDQMAFQVCSKSSKSQLVYFKCKCACFMEIQHFGLLYRQLWCKYNPEILSKCQDWRFMLQTPVLMCARTKHCPNSSRLPWTIRLYATELCSSLPPISSWLVSLDHAQVARSRVPFRLLVALEKGIRKYVLAHLKT